MLLRIQEIVCGLVFYACLTMSRTCGQRFNPYSSRPPFYHDDDYMQEDVHFFGPPSSPFWQQIWDVYNYRPPLQENTFARPQPRPVTRPYATSYDYQNQYPGPDYFVPQTDTTYRPVREEVTSGGEDEYSRYRDYFFRRYGTNLID